MSDAPPDVPPEYERGLQAALAQYAFPCPPLPVLVVREEAGAVDAVSSHDLLQTAREAARGRGAPPEAHLANLARYGAELDGLFPEYPSGGPVPDGLAERVYAAMQRYTRETLAAYMGRPADTVDARFAPLDAVRRGDAVHRRAAEHLCLHRRVAGDASLELPAVAGLAYPDLLLLFFARFCADGAAEGVFKGP
jgi:hypothetical protein